MRSAEATSTAQAADLLLPDLLGTCTGALAAADSFLACARQAVAAQVAPGGKVDAALLEREQVAAHGYAWLAIMVCFVLHQLLNGIMLAQPHSRL